MTQEALTVAEAYEISENSWVKCPLGHLIGDLRLSQHISTQRIDLNEVFASSIGTHEVTRWVESGAVGFHVVKDLTDGFDLGWEVDVTFLSDHGN
jgi:hypothetical protein